MRATLSGAKKRSAGTVPAIVPNRSSRSDCADVAERREQLLHQRRGRLQAREVDRALEAVGGLLVASLLVQGEVLAGVDRVGEQLGVAERVGDAEGDDRVLVVAGVADQRPAVAVRARGRSWGGRPVPRKRSRRTAPRTRSASSGACSNACRNVPLDVGAHLMEPATAAMDAR